MIIPEFLCAIINVVSFMLLLFDCVNFQSHVGMKEYCFSVILFGRPFTRKIADLMDSDVLKTR